MRTMMKGLIVAFVAAGLACMVTGYSQAAEKKISKCNALKEIIDNTASIKEMQSKPAPAPSYKLDALGNKVPNQTDNSGKTS